MNDPLATRQDPPRARRPFASGPRVVRRRPHPADRPVAGDVPVAGDRPVAGNRPAQGGAPGGGTLGTRMDLPRRYRIPVTPEVAWSPEEGKRHAWLARAELAAVLLVQAVLTVRLDNTVFEDEALYLYVGRVLLDGGSMEGYATYFSGAPYLYPALVAPVDQAFGLEGARMVSTLLMLGVTALLYAGAKRLYGTRPALLAAACYAVMAPTAFLGNLATYDALAVFLLALGVWLGVRFADRAVLAVLLIAPVCVLAFATKYASGIFIPSVIAMAAVAAMPRAGIVRALARGAVLAALAGLGIGAFFLLGGVAEGIGFSTTSRAAGTEDPLAILGTSAQRGGLFLLLALVGAVLYWRGGNPGDAPGAAPRDPGRPVRALTGLVMVGSGLLVPLYQANLQTSVSLTKHLGYGMLFAAPMVGLGMARLLGAHFRSPQYPIAVWVVLFAFGYGQATTMFTSWPHSADLTRTVAPEMTDKGRYLSSAPQVLIYSLGLDRTSPEQWTSTSGFTDFDAVTAGKYDLVVLDSGKATRPNAEVERRLAGNGHYRLRARLTYDHGPAKGHYRVWVKVR